jgi:small subunit ribosomal protein S6
MHTYETLFITPPTLSEDEERETVETFATVVTQAGGAFAANERLGRRRLAFPIAKHSDGVYVRFLYDSAVEVPKELERRLRLSDRILRSLTIRLEPNQAVAAKEQAVRDAAARAEAARRAAEGLPAEPEPTPPSQSGRFGDADDDDTPEWESDRDRDR